MVDVEGDDKDDVLSSLAETAVVENEDLDLIGIVNGEDNNGGLVVGESVENNENGKDEQVEEGRVEEGKDKEVAEEEERVEQVDKEEKKSEENGVVAMEKNGGLETEADKVGVEMVETNVEGAKKEAADGGKTTNKKRKMVGEEKQGAAMAEITKKIKMMMMRGESQNPMTQLQTKYKELESGFKAWLAKQSMPVEAAVVTFTSAVQGAAIGGLMGTLTNDFSSALPTPPPNAALNPQAMASLQQAQALAGGPLVQARNFAVMTGVNAGITSVMKRVRGKEDVQSSMVAAFGSGAMFSLVSGMGGPNQAASAVTSGLFFALIQGGLFKVGEKFSKPPVEDVLYNKTRSMLSNLGLQKYEKNFKKGLLTDNTLPLLSDSALRDVQIPPGPRLLILDQIQRDPALKETRGAFR